MTVEDSIYKCFCASCGEVEFLHKLVVDLYVTRSLLHNVTSEDFSTIVGEGDAKVFPFFYPR